MSLVFASILRLRGADAQDAILAVLSPERRSAVQAELKTMADAPPAQIEARLREIREEQQKAQRQRAQERLGCSLDHALPRLAVWIGRPF